MVIFHSLVNVYQRARENGINGMVRWKTKLWETWKAGAAKHRDGAVKLYGSIVNYTAPKMFNPRCPAKS